MNEDDFASGYLRLERLEIHLYEHQARLIGVERLLRESAMTRAVREPILVDAARLRGFLQSVALAHKRLGSRLTADARRRTREANR